jgi:hypothetical protein
VVAVSTTSSVDSVTFVRCRRTDSREVPAIGRFPEKTSFQVFNHKPESRATVYEEKSAALLARRPDSADKPQNRFPSLIFFKSAV